MNFEKNRFEWRTFYLWDKGEQEVYEIKLENGETVICTGDHKWYVEDENNQIKIVKTLDLNNYNHIINCSE